MSKTLAGGSLRISHYGFDASPVEIGEGSTGSQVSVGGVSWKPPSKHGLVVVISPCLPSRKQETKAQGPKKSNGVYDLLKKLCTKNTKNT